jgi:hypothetical protein
LLSDFSRNLSALLADGRVWQSAGAALAMGGVALLVGVVLMRRVGLLRTTAPVGETIAVGLSAGLIIITVIWASIASAGRSAFTPIALAILVAMALSRSSGAKVTGANPAGPMAFTAGRPRLARLGPFVLAAAAIVLLGVMYGVTMAPSPQDGAQPVEFMDEAYYSILGRDLAETGVEDLYGPSGFDKISGLPTQTWYHWGEAWLASIPIRAFALDSILARHYVALPLLLLAAAALAGTLVRRMTRSRSRRAFAFGAVMILFLAPFPASQTFFAQWPRNLTFGISMYGMAIVVVLLILVLWAMRRERQQRMSADLMVASIAASLLPTHIVMCLLAVVGVGAVASLELLRAFARRRPVGPLLSRPRDEVLTIALLAVTFAWGLLTGHGLGTTGLASSVTPFNSTWLLSITINLATAGAFLAIPIATVWFARHEPDLTRLGVGAMALLAAGAFAWGWRLGDFTMFHVLYGGIAVFAAPIAAVAAWRILRELRRRRHRSLAVVLAGVIFIQLELGVVGGLARLAEFGPGDYDATPISVNEAIRRLPPTAKLAYACNPLEEIGFFWDPRLISVYAHTGRPIVPMCFQAEFFANFNGANRSPDVISPLFLAAPQRQIYPDAHAAPSSGTIAEFLRQHGINYIYVDRKHPNTLVPGANTVVSSGSTSVLALP